MRISYDPAKRASNLEKHGIDFEDAAEVFAGPAVTVPERRYAEERYQTFGYLGGRIVQMVWTPRGNDVRRVISMRKCNAREQARVRQQLGPPRRDDR